LRSAEGCSSAVGPPIEQVQRELASNMFTEVDS
jgi:hypothetical protein